MTVIKEPGSTEGRDVGWAQTGRRRDVVRAEKAATTGLRFKTFTPKKKKKTGG